MIKATFSVPWEYRNPTVDVGEYPWWITGTNDSGDATVVAYESGIPDVSKQWPDLYIESLEIEEVDVVVYTDQFPYECSWWRVW